MLIDFIRPISFLLLGPRSFKAGAMVTLAGTAWKGEIHVYPSRHAERGWL